MKKKTVYAKLYNIFNGTDLQLMELNIDAGIPLVHFMLTTENFSGGDGDSGAWWRA